MQFRIHEIQIILKTIFICAVIIFTLCYGGIGTPLTVDKQNFDIIPAAMISIGFGTALCMILNKHKIYSV